MSIRMFLCSFMRMDIVASTGLHHHYGFSPGPETPRPPTAATNGVRWIFCGEQALPLVGSPRR